MIPALAVMIAAYTIARLAQVFNEHSPGDADRHKRIQLCSVLGISGILIGLAIVLTRAETVAELLKQVLKPELPK